MTVLIVIVSIIIGILIGYTVGFHVGFIRSSRTSLTLMKQILTKKQFEKYIRSIHETE